jgi:hypothetical protein
LGRAERGEDAAVTWREIIPVHPAADVFPLLAPEELKALAEDIEKHGLQSPVVWWKDYHEVYGSFRTYILDGRNRLDALELLGKKPIRSDGAFLVSALQHADGVPLGGHHSYADPSAYVISANIRRRHLTKQQQAELIVAAVAAGGLSSANLAEVSTKPKRGPAPDPVKTKAVEVAAEHGISERTVERVLTQVQPERKRPRKRAAADVDEYIEVQPEDIIEEMREKSRCSHCEVHCPSGRYRRAES